MPEKTRRVLSKVWSCPDMLKLCEKWRVLRYYGEICIVPKSVKEAVCTEGFPEKEVGALLKQWRKEGLHVVIVSNNLGEVKSSEGMTYDVDQNFLTGSPLSYEGAYLVGGTGVDDYFHHQARTFIMNMYNHFKPIGAREESAHLIKEMGIGRDAGGCDGYRFSVWPEIY